MVMAPSRCMVCAAVDEAGGEIDANDFAESAGELKAAPAHGAAEIKRAGMCF